MELKGEQVRTVRVRVPEEEQHVIMHANSDAQYEFDFDIRTATFDRLGNGLLVMPPNGGTVAILDFFSSNSGALPKFVMQDGSELDSSLLLVVQSPDIDLTIESSSISLQAPSSGLNRYTDTTLTLVPGVKAKLQANQSPDLISTPVLTHYTTPTKSRPEVKLGAIIKKPTVVEEEIIETQEERWDPVALQPADIAEEQLGVGVGVIGNASGNLPKEPIKEVEPVEVVPEVLVTTPDPQEPVEVKPDENGGVDPTIDPDVTDPNVTDPDVTDPDVTDPDDKKPGTCDKDQDGSECDDGTDENMQSEISANEAVDLPDGTDVTHALSMLEKILAEYNITNIQQTDEVQQTVERVLEEQFSEPHALDIVAATLGSSDMLHIDDDAGMPYLLSSSEQDMLLAGTYAFDENEYTLAFNSSLSDGFIDSSNQVLLAFSDDEATALAAATPPAAFDEPVVLHYNTAGEAFLGGVATPEADVVAYPVYAPAALEMLVSGSAGHVMGAVVDTLQQSEESPEGFFTVAKGVDITNGMAADLLPFTEVRTAPHQVEYVMQTDVEESVFMQLNASLDDEQQFSVYLQSMFG